MDRASRFLWDMHCGRKDRKMFKKAMGLLCQVIQQTGALALLTDGEKRYGSLLFELCSRKRSRGKLIKNQWVNFLGFAFRFY